MNPNSFELNDNDGYPFIAMTVDKMEPGEPLVSMQCIGGDANLTKELINDISGGSICIAYFRDPHSVEKPPTSDLILMYCSKAVILENLKDTVVTGPTEASFHLYGTSSLSTVRTFGPDIGSRVFIKPIMPFSHYKRTIYTLMRIDEIPSEIVDVLFGQTSKEERVDVGLIPIESLKQKVNDGSLRYINKLNSQEETKLD